MAFSDESPPSSAAAESNLLSISLPPSPHEDSPPPPLYLSRSHSLTPRSSQPSRLSRFAPRQPGRKKKSSQRRRRGVLIWSALLAFFFLMNWWMFSRLQDPMSLPRRAGPGLGFLKRSVSNSSLSLKDQLHNLARRKRPHKVMLSRLRALAAHALAEAERKPEPLDLWKEPVDPTTSWKPCADKCNWEPCEGKNGYILVSANGGINQQRVAICNAVAIARLLNSTLVIPKFLYNSVWRDVSQFSNIYQEDYFINYLKNDIHIVKQLPLELQSLDLEAIGSLVTDAELAKESKPSFYLKKILPILLKNGVVHFVGFGNRLSFDPIPFELQRLRCRCNFHALKFENKIQETGALIIKRMHGNRPEPSLLEQNILGEYANKSIEVKGKKKRKNSKYLAVHLRFEMDMAAYSMCYFGGGREEEEELEIYRQIHFPALTNLRKTTKVPSAVHLRAEGQCPLTPEEAVLMLAALGFKRSTNIYIAGAEIYGGKSRMAAIRHLYPKISTKETLLSQSEIRPFLNFSSQLAALDFIACAASDAFAMTDSGSQLSSLVQGMRMYFGENNLPSIRPNKRRLASIFSKNTTIEWKEFEDRVRKLIKQTKQVHDRPVARSVYRHPRCAECMCKVENNNNNNLIVENKG
ncbi:hypothetical protein LUZ60_000282 [Juncus effusus]|nr:hypothetical protein LUZ60_000282 [Juncus effusus]